jgi:purine nucleoside phosphorylase
MLAMIGGSGVYNIEGLSNTRWVRVDSPFGTPSDELLLGELDGQPLAFLPRHGRGHQVPPSAINYRANIDALKRAGATQIISVSAVGSLRMELPPGTFVIVDQFIDRTFARAKSFFGTGLVAHVSMAHPVCARLGDAIEAAAQARQIRYVRGGTYLVMEGPQFSTLAESRDRHDQHAGSEARARSGAVLCDRGDGHRLRLLASRARCGHGGDGGQDGACQRRPCARAAEGGGAGDAATGPSALSARLSAGT